MIPDAEARREIEEFKKMTLKEKARFLGEAMKFCLSHGLISPAERQQMATDPEFSRQMAFKAMARRQLWRKAHSEAELPLSEEEKQMIARMEGWPKK
ncbi:unknown [Prevotella sp. CAG:1031]|nr:unknown [Prevotella sp. CAG:1031]